MHLRIAQLLAEHIKPSSAKKFYIGSIAPDSGIICSDGRSYDPPKRLSHWQDEYKKYRFDEFYTSYLSDCNALGYDFYTGYYSHLVTDYLWVKRIYMPSRAAHFHEFDSEAEFSCAVRKDWFQTDLLFLRENKGFEPLRVLRKTENFINTYFSYFTQDAIIMKIHEIVKTYDGVPIDDEHDYPYLNSAQADAFVHEAAKYIINDMSSRLHTVR